MTGHKTTATRRQTIAASACQGKMAHRSFELAKKAVKAPHGQPSEALPLPGVSALARGDGKAGKGYAMSAVAIIPARGGSRRIPMKNVRPFYGKPIMLYSIETALASGLFEFVMVSTDNTAIADIAANNGARVHIRSKGHSMNSIGTQEVVKVVLEEEPSQFAGIEHGACVYATAPMLDVGTLRVTHAMIRHNRSAFVYTVCGWRDAAQVYWGQKEAFLDGVPLDHWSTGRFQIPAERFCDINTEADWQRAVGMYADLDRGKS